jgi:predicted DNA-binding transcriptional regulator AlpA
MPDPKEYCLIDVGGVARILSIHPQTVRKMVKRGQLPPSIVIGKQSRRWRRCDIIEWAEARFPS